MGYNPFFSVIIPYFNKGSDFELCLNSLVSQSFSCFEVIIIDDHSTDGYINKAEEYLNLLNIRVISRISKLNAEGGYAARNLGILNSSSNWIVFLDADDIWKENHLSYIYKLISTEYLEYGFIGTSFLPFYNNDTIIYEDNNDFEYTIYTLENLPISLPFYTSSICVSKNLIINNGLFPEGLFSRGGDVDTWYRIIFSLSRIYHIKSVTVLYNKSADNMVTNNPFKISDFKGEKNLIFGE